MKEYEEIPLSDSEVLELVDGKANLITYKELRGYRNIDEVLGKNEACIILFESKPNYGHWCCLIKRGNVVEFFNPYGDVKKIGEGYPDECLRYINKIFRKESGQDEPILTKLLLECDYELEYNQYPFQKMKNGINTCGRHCATRIMMKDMELDEYALFIYTLAKTLGVSMDEIVTAITYYVNIV